MELKDKKILITGANGLVGSRLVEKLYLGHNAKITALVRNMGRSSRIGRMKVKIERGDILDKKLVERLTKDADIVLHLVLGGKKPIIDGTKIIARCARMYDVERFVHMSTAAVHGFKPNEDHTTEGAPLRKIGHWYPDSKIEAEHIVNRETKRGLRSVILRPRIIWGPYSFWVTDFYKQTAGDTFHIVNDGEGACNTIFIDNLIDAVILSATDEKAIGETFFVTDDEHITWKRYYERWASFLDRDINFLSIDSNDFTASRKKPNILREFKSFIVSSTMKDFLLEAPLINRITRPLIFDYFPQLPEERKNRLKEIIGYNRPAAHSMTGEEAFPAVDELKIDRESGKGFTSIEKIKKTLGYSANIDFQKGSEITREWLQFAGFLDG